MLAMKMPYRDNASLYHPPLANSTISAINTTADRQSAPPIPLYTIPSTPNLPILPINGPVQARSHLQPSQYQYQPIQGQHSPLEAPLQNIQLPHQPLHHEPDYSPSNHESYMVALQSGQLMHEARLSNGVAPVMGQMSHLPPHQTMGAPPGLPVIIAPGILGAPPGQSIHQMHQAPQPHQQRPGMPFYLPYYMSSTQYPQVYQPQYMPLRHFKSRKKLKHLTIWTGKEDRLLRELKEVQKLGWREMLSYFEDRTPNACQFRWRRLVSGTTEKERLGDSSSKEDSGQIENVKLLSNEGTGNQTTDIKVVKLPNPTSPHSLNNDKVFLHDLPADDNAEELTHEKRLKASDNLNHLKIKNLDSTELHNTFLEGDSSICVDDDAKHLVNFLLN